jgi:hypothetical protein
MSTSAERMRALRARRAAAIEPAGGPRLRDAGELLGPAVEASLAALKLGEPDQAAAQLARRYAAAIDEAESPAAALRALGPLLAKALEALGATPAARKGLPRQAERAAPSKVAQLRAAHAASKAKYGRKA